MTDYDQTHAKRWEKSLEWIAPVADKAERILEIGGSTRFTELVNARWPGKLKPFYGGDLRGGFFIRDCDLILAMEVLEHVEDAEHEGIQAEWHGTGVHNVLTSCWMSLSLGGHLFITTPNANSATVLHHVLNMAPPAIFRPHIREYSVYELDEMVRSVGFEILRRECLDVWNSTPGKQHRAIMDFIRKEKYDDHLRGECTFALCRKPLETTTVS